MRTRTYAGAALDEMAKRKHKPAKYEGWDSDQPRECYVCGKPIRISRDNCGFRTMAPRVSWHFDCAKGAPVE